MNIGTTELALLTFAVIIPLIIVGCVLRGLHQARRARALQERQAQDALSKLAVRAFDVAPHALRAPAEAKPRRIVDDPAAYRARRDL